MHPEDPVNLEGKWKAIWIGGVITGLASLVPVLNLTCCLIPFAGAIIAVVIYSSSAPARAISNNDGMAIGAMTGVIATAVYAVLIIPIVYFFGNLVGGFLGPLAAANDQVSRNVQLFIEMIGNNLGAVLAVLLFFKIVSQLAMSGIFGLLGGLAGAALFRRSAV